MTARLPLPDIVGRFWPRGQSAALAEQAFVEGVRADHTSWQHQSDRKLKEATTDLRRKFQAGANPTDLDILTPAFSIVVEAFQRALGIVLYDVQLLAGLALARMNVAEMRTGEGKTFVAALPAFVHSLAGEGVHVMTVNDYLATRDYEQLLPAFRLMGVSAGILKVGDSVAGKQKAYACDVTYGPGYEFGFDYLRDQAALMSRHQPTLGASYRALLRGEREESPPLRQRGHAVAVVDEVDSVLLDEATTPLILTSGGSQACEDDSAYRAAERIAGQLTPKLDFVHEPATRRLQITEVGRSQCGQLGEDVPRRCLHRPWPSYVEQALKAKHLFRRDIDYVVSDDKVQLVDQNTGRIFSDRSWSDGLQQAVEAKEQVTITAENQPLARITRQRYFRLYKLNCGMTGTAAESRREFREVYKLDISTIPTRKPCQRQSLPTRFFADRDAKYDAIVAEVVRIHGSGQPILVGTTTIEQSQILAERLTDAEVPFQLLNGMQNAQEAAIVARGGKIGAVTIATNMAGRGTDIKLGGGAGELGGLHVIATELQESSRIDRQLIGRSARQGDPGSCQRFVAADDRIIAQYAPALAHRMLRLADESREIHVDLSADINRLQRKIERLRYRQRQQMFAADDWLDKVKQKLSGE